MKEIKNLVTYSKPREVLTGLLAVQKEALHLGNTKSRTTRLFTFSQEGRKTVLPDSGSHVFSNTNTRP